MPLCLKWCKVSVCSLHYSFGIQRCPISCVHSEYWHFNDTHEIHADLSHSISFVRVQDITGAIIPTSHIPHPTSNTSHLRPTWHVERCHLLGLFLVARSGPQVSHSKTACQPKVPQLFQTHFVLFSICHLPHRPLWVHFRGGCLTSISAQLFTLI